MKAQTMQKRQLEYIWLSNLKLWEGQREIRAENLSQIVDSIERDGFNPSRPLRVFEDGDSYEVAAGGHRLEALRTVYKEGHISVPCIVEPSNANPHEVAISDNRSDEASASEDVFDHLDRIDQLREQGHTQKEIGEILGWSRGKVSNYCQVADNIATSILDAARRHQEGRVADNATSVAFTEGLFRRLVPLTDEQQEYLITGYAKRGMQRSTLIQKAETFRDRNRVVEFIEDELEAVDQDLFETAVERAENGDFDDEWDGGPSDRLEEYVAHIREKQLDREQFELYHADIEDATEILSADSADWVITDPPYPSEFLALYTTLSKVASEILRPGGSALVMCGQSYLPEVIDRLTEHLSYHWAIAYRTPGGQAVQQWDREVNTFWKPVLWLTNGEYDGDWVGDVVTSDANDNDKRFHDWGQSLSGMSDLVSKFTFPGHTVVDPFVGGGTTGVAALDEECQFIGLDNDEAAIETTRERLMKAVNHD